MDNRNFQDILELLDKAETIDDLHNTCRLYCEAYDYDNFIYGARIPTSFVKPYFVFISSYPDEWRNYYVENEYLKYDPTVTHCATHSIPINWAQTDKTNKIMLEARDFSLNSGLSVPLHTLQGEFAMLSVASSEGYQKSKIRIIDSVAHTQLLISYLHERVKKIISLDSGQIERSVKLTKREQECLLWISEGKTTWETSQILKISERTIIFHLHNASIKLGVVNRQQAVAKAVIQGIITPQMGS